MLTTGCSEDDDNFEDTTCEDSATIVVGDYTMYNDMWAKRYGLFDGSLPHEQCIWARKDTSLIQYGWNWEWPIDNYQSKALPQIQYKGRHTKSIDRLAASYNIQANATGSYGHDGTYYPPKYGTVFQIMLRNATTNAITHEIMIWMDLQNWDVSSDRIIERITIDGEQYDFYKFYVNHGSWAYLGFKKIHPRLSGNINLYKFLNYLKQTNHIPADISSVREVIFGMEICYGIGQATVFDYTVYAN